MLRPSPLKQCIGALLIVLGLFACSPDPSEQLEDAPEVIVFGTMEETRAWLESEGWWGPEKHGEQLQAPRVLIAGITERWRSDAQDIPVSEKKEAFYRFMLPLILHANEMVMERRKRLETAGRKLAAGEPLSGEELEQLRRSAVQLRVQEEQAIEALPDDSPEWRGIIDELLYRLDIVPPGLALGQAAYESGYGTSRFAQEGNALFGQWTYGGEGLVPEKQRKNLGDHRIAAFEWPFDSVRSYYINLMSHPAYEAFRKLRAERRSAGQPLSSLDLADGLVRYSERGQKYVDTLKGIIRANNLEMADNAVFRDEPLRFYLGAEGPEDAERLRAEIQRLRESGELTGIIARMRLE